MATRENGEQRCVGGGGKAAFAEVALVRPGLETTPTLGGTDEKKPTENGWFFK